MEKLDRIVKFLDQYLEADSIKDSSWNGLQYEGKQEVKKILFAADAALATFEKAVTLHANLIVVHHGIYWNTTNPCLVGWLKKRVRVLWDNGISLYASHLPLDRHRVVGNNAQLLKLLGAGMKRAFCEFNGKSIGWLGEFKRPLSLQKIEHKLNQRLKTHCTVLPFGKKKVKSIAVVSGGGGSKGFHEAVRAKSDLYLTGEIFDAYHAARDISINVIFGGHHATEILGVKALATLIGKKFKITSVFVDIPTGL